MGHKITVRCDECEVERLACNHWYRIYYIPNGIRFVQFDSARRPADSVVCGEGHLLMQIQRYLSTGSLRRPSGSGESIGVPNTGSD